MDPDSANGARSSPAPDVDAPDVDAPDEQGDRRPGAPARSIRAITVYCSSSDYLDPQFFEAADELGTSIARLGLTLVYGGGCVGLMGQVSRSARQAGGTVVGVIPGHLYAREVGDEKCDELIVTETMRQRKQILDERADAFIMLPGGVGTYEEFFEILVGRQLGEHAKPIGVVNAHGYYNPLVSMIEHGIEHRFIRQDIYEHFVVHPDVDSVLRAVLEMGGDLPAVERAG